MNTWRGNVTSRDTDAKTVEVGDTKSDFVEKADVVVMKTDQMSREKEQQQIKDRSEETHLERMRCENGAQRAGS